MSKAFKKIQDASKVELYDDKSGPVLYRSWKAALEREVSHLSLNAAQWLELLKVRTKGEALKVVQDTTNHLMPESTPESTLKITWEFLDERFLTSQQPSQEILNNILNGVLSSGSGSIRRAVDDPRYLQTAV